MLLSLGMGRLQLVYQVKVVRVFPSKDRIHPASNHTPLF